MWTSMSINVSQLWSWVSWRKKTHSHDFCLFAGTKISFVVRNVMRIYHVVINVQNYVMYQHQLNMLRVVFLSTKLFNHVDIKYVFNVLKRRRFMIVKKTYWDDFLVIILLMYLVELHRRQLIFDDFLVLNVVMQCLVVNINVQELAAVAELDEFMFLANINVAEN